MEVEVYKRSPAHDRLYLKFKPTSLALKLSRPARYLDKLKLLNLVLITPLSRTAWACCFKFDLPVHVNLTGPRFNVPELTNSYKSTAFIIGSVSRNVNGSALTGGEGHIDRSYKIHFQYCEPKSEESYWDFGGEVSNYIKAANAAGYATLNYDRLGVGKSEHADPYFDVQLNTQIAILKRLMELVQSEHLSKHIPVPGKIVHVGNSYGSLITDGLTTTLELCLGFEVAGESNTERFGALASGYLTWGREYSNQCVFFDYPFFEIEVLKKAEAGKAPFATAELLSFTSVDIAAPGFRKPVLQMLSGQADLPFCGGECHGILDGPDAPSPSVFLNTSPFLTYVHPNAAHGINLHHNASAAYEVVNTSLGENGL
ncbi:hypothetical protein BJX62DRAFT_239390 [Aspergillus germanicus]